MSKNSINGLRGTTLEGQKGAVVAALLGMATLALVAAMWFLLPEEVMSHSASFVQSASYMPKWVLVSIVAVLGVGGAAWLAATRAKIGLAASCLGFMVGLVVFAMNML